MVTSASAGPRAGVVGSTGTRNRSPACGSTGIATGGGASSSIATGGGASSSRLTIQYAPSAAATNISSRPKPPQPRPSTSPRLGPDVFGGAACGAGHCCCGA